MNEENNPSRPSRTGWALAVVASESPAHDAICSDLKSHGATVWRCDSRLGLRSLLASPNIDLLVSELRLRDGPTLDIIEWFRGTAPSATIVVSTHYASIATAVKCGRIGVDAYFAGPVSLTRLLDQLNVPNSADRRSTTTVKSPMRLERAVWEYIHRVVTDAGSIANAANRLGIDRRSLRRMLNKYAPR